MICLHEKLRGQYMDTKYLKKLQTMKPSEFVEEVFGIKLLLHQKFIVDNAANYPGRIYIMYPRGVRQYKNNVKEV